MDILGPLCGFIAVSHLFSDLKANDEEFELSHDAKIASFLFFLGIVNE